MTEVTVNQIQEDLETNKNYDYQRNAGKIRPILIETIEASEDGGARIVFSMVGQPEAKIDVRVPNKNIFDRSHHFYVSGAQSPPGGNRKRTSRKKITKRIRRKGTRKHYQPAF